MTRYPRSRVGTVGTAYAYLPLRKEPTGGGARLPEEAPGLEPQTPFLRSGENAPGLVLETVRTPDDCQLRDVIKFEI
jgi:hypothetical protein